MASRRRENNVECCVITCFSMRRKYMNQKFHPFPKRGEIIQVYNENGALETWDRRALWKKKVQWSKGVSHNMRVCSRHFVDQDYECVAPGRHAKKRLRPTAYPSQNLPGDKLELHKLRKILKIHELNGRKTQMVDKNVTPGTDVTSKTDNIDEETAVEALLLLGNLTLNQQALSQDEGVKSSEGTLGKRKMCDVGTQADASNGNDTKVQVDNKKMKLQ